MASTLFCQWRRHGGPLGRSKTDQTGEGEVVFITRRAMSTLGELRQLREVYGDASPSVFGRRPDDQPLGQGGGAGGGPGRGVSGHSGRAGLARRMARAGAPDSAIMRQVRWSSSAMVARYTRGESAGDAARWLELRARAGALWFLCFIILTCRVAVNIMRSIVPSSVFHPSGSRPREFRPASLAARGPGYTQVADRCSVVMP